MHLADRHYIYFVPYKEQKIHAFIHKKASGDFVPTEALPLDPAGELPFPRPLTSRPSLEILIRP